MTEEKSEIQNKPASNDPGSEGEYRSASPNGSNSSSIRYRSSSAEPIENERSKALIGKLSKIDNDNTKRSHDDKNRRSTSRSPNYYAKRIDFRRRPFKKFHRHHQYEFHNRNRKFNRYNNNYRKRRAYSRSRSPSSDSSNASINHKRHRRSSPSISNKTQKLKNDTTGEKTADSDSDNDGKTANVLKPSDIKNNAKQSAKSFLDMLEEKRKMSEVFAKTVLLPVETKKQIAVKMPKFVNTFNSLSAAGGTTTTTTADSADMIANENANKSQTAPNAVKNSSCEEGEIRSDLDEQKGKSKTKKSKKKNDLRKLSKKQKKKKLQEIKSANNKKRKNKNSKKKRSSSSSSSSTSSSSSSSTSNSSSSESSSDSDSDSSVSSSSSDSDASESSSSYSSSSSSSSNESNRKRKRSKKNAQKSKLKKKMSKKHRKIKNDAKRSSNKRPKKSIKNGSKASESSDNDSKKESSPSLSEPSKIAENNALPWPKEMILFTKTEPSIEFSINQLCSNDLPELIPQFEAYDPKNNQLFSNEQSISRRTPVDINSPNDVIANNEIISTDPMKMNMNHDYDYYYRYYYDTNLPYRCDNANNDDGDIELQMASHYHSYYRMLSSYDYSQKQLEEYVSKHGYRLIETNKYDHHQIMEQKNEDEKSNIFKVEDSLIKVEPKDEINDENKNDENQIYTINVMTTNNISSSISSDYIQYYPKGFNLEQSSQQAPGPPSPPPSRPIMTVLETTEWIDLPTGIKVPPGTKQIIVHPYNRPIY